MDDYFDSKAVIFLEYSDFDNKGQFIHDLQGMNMIVMVGGSFCGHCKHTAPVFNEFVKKCREDREFDEFKNTLVHAFVQVDGSDNEKALGVLFKDQFGVSGIPVFLLFDSTGKYIKTHDGARTIKGLTEFCRTK